MFFGTQCEHLGSGGWDVLDNVTQQMERSAIRGKRPNSVCASRRAAANLYFPA